MLVLLAEAGKSLDVFLSMCGHICVCVCVCVGERLVCVRNFVKEGGG
jgi:hypothetical protein